MVSEEPGSHPIEYALDLLDLRVRARTIPPRIVWDLAVSPLFLGGRVG